MDMKVTRKGCTKWHSVCIVLQTSSCAAAAICRNDRFLSKEAPHLPVVGCDHPETCECTYRHFEDRRNGMRRWSELGVAGQSDAPKGERRKMRGRRAQDKR